MSVRLFTQNFIDRDFLANDDVSSAQNAFPVDNAYNRKRRSKLWRSNGYWNIEAGKNTIIFRETSAGPDLTATIPVAEYSSSTTFLAAIKAAFELTGASTYTITQDANLRINIASNGVGGAGDFELDWLDVASADMAGILGFSTASEDLGVLTYTADILKINTGEWIEFDMGVASNPKNFMMSGPRNTPLTLSPSGTFTLQGNETTNWASPSYSQVLTYDDEVIAILSTGGLHTEALRFWRILFTDQNPQGYVEIGVFFLGDHFSNTQGAVNFPLLSGFDDASVTVLSEGLQSFSDIRPQSQTYELSWNGLVKGEIEEFTDFYRDFGNHTPFFISLDTNSVYSSSLNRRLLYVKFTGNPSYELIRPNLFTMRQSIREEL